jgi:tRNA splicing endonuclease
MKEEDLTVQGGKNTSVGIWCEDKMLIELKTFRGNFWRVMGFSQLGRNYLYPEEALYLMEKKHLQVLERNDISFRRDHFYNMITGIISLEAYLVYAKLRVRNPCCFELLLMDTSSRC